MNKSNLKLLLIQIRQNENVKKEEVSSFARLGDIDENQITIFDAFKNQALSLDELKNYDAILIGGASEASVLEPKKYPFVSHIQNAIKDCLAYDIPVFASCFGFQVAVLALNGKILRDEENFEMGTIPINLTKSAQNDECFKNTSNPFIAVSVHQEKAIDLPHNCIKLAFTNECIHAFKVKNKRFWAFQFHPELDDICLRERLTIYKEKYTENSEQLQKVIDNISPTPESNALVFNFINSLIAQ